MKQTEVGLIPDDWEVKTLGELCSFSNGVAHESFVDENGGYILVNSKFISSEGEVVKFSKKQLFPILPNSVLMVMSDVPNGKAIAKCFLVPSKFKGTLNQRICMFTDFKANNEFLYRIINRNKYYLAFDDGVKQTNLRKQDVLNCPIPIPPTVAEQHRIAKALSDVDALISTTEKLIQKKKNIKQGAMQSLLTGKKRLPSFAAASKFKQTELGEIPEDWEVKMFGDYASIMRGGSPRPIQNYLTTNSDGINWIKIGDVKPEDKYIVATEEKIIPEGKSRSREVHKGDFILSNSMSFGRPYILQIDGCIHDGWLAIQNYQESFDTDFLYYLLGSDEIFEQYIEMAAGSSVQNLNKEKVAKLLVPIFDKKEQTAIANVLSSMDKEIESLNTKLEKYRNLKTAMMQQLLTGKIRLR